MLEELTELRKVLSIFKGLLWQMDTNQNQSKEETQGTIWDKEGSKYEVSVSSEVPDPPGINVQYAYGVLSTESSSKLWCLEF